jgi:hypothetical protein
MRWFVLSLTCVAVAGVAATAAIARTAVHPAPHPPIVATTGPTPPLRTGLQDPIFDGPQKATAFAMASQTGATYVRIIAAWSSIAPATLPSHGFDPTDPTSPYYNWSALDSSVSAAEAAGITPILEIFAPPGWAYAVPRGTWTGGTPQIAALGAFATALAKHYNGSGPAPAVHAFSVWNEPNFSRNLYPQDPTVYRSMVNAVADSVHAVNPANLVVAGELAPVKHAPGPNDQNTVIPPLDFMRTMLCISNTNPAQRTCNTPAKFDVWAHHPYSDTGPFGRATVSGGVELGDLPAMESLLQTAQQLGAISSAKPVQFWVTEFGWSSNPPNKKGAPMSLEARWVPESLYLMWQSGVTLGIWFLLQDEPSNTPFQSGLYLRSTSLSGAKAKPLLTAFSFPFVAYLQPHGKVNVWGRDATSDRQDVTIQERMGSGGAWKTVATITSNSYGIFQATLSLGAKSKYWLRASAPGSGTAVPFALKAPKNEHLKVIPFPLSN